MCQRFQCRHLARLPQLSYRKRLPKHQRTILGSGSGVYVKERLQEAGYHVEDRIIDCRQFGVPQSRNRLILLASQLGPIKMVQEMHMEPSSWIYVQSTMRHLPAMSAGEVDRDDPLHRSSQLSDFNLQRIRASTPGRTWNDCPIKLKAPCHRRVNGRTYSAVYGQMEWENRLPH